MGGGETTGMVVLWAVWQAYGVRKHQTYNCHDPEQLGCMVKQDPTGEYYVCGLWDKIVSRVTQLHTIYLVCDTSHYMDLILPGYSSEKWRIFTHTVGVLSGFHWLIPLIDRLSHDALHLYTQDSATPSIYVWPRRSGHSTLKSFYRFVDRCIQQGTT